MAICPLCGKRVIAGKGNSTIVDGELVHKKCPRKSKPQDPNKKLLIDEVYTQFETNAKGYVVDRGFNYFKLMKQIDTLYELGYSYQDQLYALKKVIEGQGGFYGYTSVVNQIPRIIAQKRKRDEVLEQVHNSKHEEVKFDFNKFMESGDDEW